MNSYTNDVSSTILSIVNGLIRALFEHTWLPTVSNFKIENEERIKHSPELVMATAAPE